MLKQVTINITLGIRGPILCKSTFSSSWGIDATFDRDYRGKPYMDRSHIKGKLREALTEIGTQAAFIDKWFGKGDSDGGMLFISDFYPDDVSPDVHYQGKLTRIRIDRERKVVDEKALIHLENLCPLRNSPYTWNGYMEFIADDSEIKTITDEIATGFRWITAVGAEKTTGLGKIVSVETDVITHDINLSSNISPSDSSEEWLTIIIEAEDPLFTGGIQREGHYSESDDMITGAIIKGALAKTLNTLCGVDNPRSTPIDVSNTCVARHYPKLAEHFTTIRFTHAFPSTDDRRPVVIPYSAVAKDSEFYDVALSDDVQLIGGKAPVFQTDWKKFPDVFGWASPRRVVKTRTAIDSTLRRAEEDKLFTYLYICPVDSEDNRICWHGLVHLPETDRAYLHAELLDALPRIQRMGKRRSRVRVSVKTGRCDHAMPGKDYPDQDGKVIITLQSDALMIDPDEMKEEQTAEKLHELYVQYWEKVSDASTKMIRFFAHQKLLAGFHRGRYIANYYPFYLTGAGSVFVLDISNDESKAKQMIDNWIKNGLPLPEWAEEKYRKAGEALWKACPYLPENGYGEIIVNLKWHFDRDIRNTGGGR